MTDLAVGLDLGTSGLKGVVLGSDGQVVAEARAGYPTARPEPGAAEQEVSDWWRAVADVVRELARHTPAADWAGIGLSAMIPTLVAVGADGEALGPALTWEDARAEPEGEALREVVGADRVFAITGQHLDGRYLLPMWQRLRRVDPGRAAATHELRGAKDHLLWWLTGASRTDPSTAAGFGCYDLTTGSWSSEVLAAAGEVPPLPALADSRAALPLSDRRADELGLPRGLPVLVGGADSVLGALGLGVTAPGQVAYLAGTSTVVLAVSESAELTQEQPYLVTPLAGLPGVGLELDLLATGSSLRWLAELCSTDDVGLALAGTGIDPEAAPTFLPHLAPGEQGALWDPSLTGVLAGLTLQHTPAHLARALQTGIVLESRRCLTAVAAAAGVGDVRVGGGGSEHPSLAAELASATGRRVLHDPDGGHDHSAVGAALLVTRGTAATSCLRAFEPDPAGAAMWDRLARRHDELLAATRQLSG